MNRYDWMIRPVWAEIDRNALRHNLGEVRRLVGPDVEIMAVVKGEGYGHGGVETARVALEAGASWLGVALPEEGMALRRAGIFTPVLVFGILQPEQAGVFVAEGLTPSVGALEGAVALSRMALKMGKIVNCHVKIDTGMGRVGIRYDNALKFIRTLSQLPGIVVSGIYSHFASADQKDKSFAQIQLMRFREVTVQLKEAGLLPPLIHMANSAAIIDLPESHFNLVRPGIMLYGLTPSTEMKLAGKVELRPALSLKAKVIYSKQVAAGTGISYGHRYYTPQETTIVTLPIGYADGWSRRLSNQADVLIGGKRYPLVGTVCMDQCLADVGQDPVEAGAEAVLIGTDGVEVITVDDIAARLGTINYEVACMLGTRIPRVFKP